MTRFTVPAIATVVAASGFLALTAGNSLADTKVYQASSVCTGGDAAVPIGSLANNSFAVSTNIYCSINRDRTDAKPTSIKVAVVDNSTVVLGDGNFSCNLTSLTVFGFPLAPAGAAVVTTGTNPSGQILTPPIPASVANGGTLTLKCKTPRRGAGDSPSRVATITIVEPDPTN